MNDPAIGIVELNSVARGTVVTDLMVKRAPVAIVQSTPVCPGKFLIVLSGTVDDIAEAMEAGKHYGGYALTDWIVIENVHPQILPAMEATAGIPEIRSLGILETWVTPSCVVAADAACKAAAVDLFQLRLANGLGGKAFFMLTGDLHEVEAAMAAAVAAVQSGHLVRSEIVAAPHESIEPTLIG